MAKKPARSNAISQIGSAFSGVNALFGTSSDRRLIEIDIDRIRPNPHQPRKHFDEAAIEELAATIREHGLQQPIVVREAGSQGEYEIIMGERRWRASRLAGLPSIEAIVTSVSDPRDLAAFALIENVQREDLDPLEMAAAMRELMDQHGATQDALAAMLGKHKSYISRMLKLQELPRRILDDYPDHRSRVSLAQLHEIADAGDDELRIELWEAAKNGISSSILRQVRKSGAGERKAPVLPLLKLKLSYRRFASDVDRISGADLDDEARQSLRAMRDRLNAMDLG